MNGINEMTSTALISMKGKKNVSLIPFFFSFSFLIDGLMMVRQNAFSFSELDQTKDS
jgi:hypothetical protein